MAGMILPQSPVHRVRFTEHSARSTVRLRSGWRLWADAWAVLRLLEVSDERHHRSGGVALLDNQRFNDVSRKMAAAHAVAQVLLDFFERPQRHSEEARKVGVLEAAKPLGDVGRRRCRRAT